MDDGTCAKHAGGMDPIVLDGSFRPWRYLVSHLQLLLHARAVPGGAEHLSVHFEGVRAQKLRGQYRPLVLQPAGPDSRARILDFAGIPERHRSSMLCLTLPTEDDGFVVCGVASVRAIPHDAQAVGKDAADGLVPAGHRLLYVLRQYADTGTTIIEQ